MSKPPGRPKSDDPTRALTIRVRSSILSGFPDSIAARRAIEALVQARYGPGLTAEIAKAVGEMPSGLNKAAPALIRAMVEKAPPSAFRPHPKPGKK